MWQHRDSLQRRSGPRMFILATGVLAALTACAGFVSAQEDPVEDLQQALASIRLEDLTAPNETVINFRRDTLKRKIRNLRNLGELRRALALEEWKPIDVGMRKEVADIFTKEVDRLIKNGDPTARRAVANLIAEIGPTIRSVDPNPPNDRAGFARSLTKQVIELTRDPVPEVQQEALRALGNINPLPREAFGPLREALQRDIPPSRREAASALKQLVRVVGFLQKRGRTAAGIESTKTEVIEVAWAAAAGASYGLADPDPVVRQICLEAIDESARAAADMILDPFARKDYPPEGRTLTEEERKELQGPLGPAAVAMAELRQMEGVFKAYQAEMPLIARDLRDADGLVALEALRALEDIATARVRLFRRVLSAPAVTKAEVQERRNALQAIDPLAFFVSGNRLDDIYRLVRGGSAQQRNMAVQVLELFGDDAIPALPVLAEAVCDKDRNVQWSAARAIANIAPRQATMAVPGLAKMLLSLDDNLRLQASATLEAMGAEARAALPEIIKAITSGDSETRVAAMAILASIGAEHDRPAIPALIEALGDADPRVRRAAAETLGKLASIAAPAVPALRQALEDDDQDVRLNASEALLAIVAPPIEK